MMKGFGGQGDRQGEGQGQEASGGRAAPLPGPAQLSRRRRRHVAVKLRLMRMGKKKQPTYRVVAADSRSPRDGRFIEIIGTYEPRARAVASSRSTTTRPSTGCARAPSPPSTVAEAAQDLGRLGGVQGAGVIMSDARRRRTIERRRRRRGRRATTSDDDELDDVNRDRGRDRPQPCSSTWPRRSSTTPTPWSIEAEEPAAWRQPAACTWRPTTWAGSSGERGRVANAIRTVVRAAGAADGVEVDVDFVD